MQAPGGEGAADRASVAVAGATQEYAARVERCAMAPIIERCVQLGSSTDPFEGVETWDRRGTCKERVAAQSGLPPRPRCVSVQAQEVPY